MSEEMGQLETGTRTGAEIEEVNPDVLAAAEAILAASVPDSVVMSQPSAFQPISPFALTEETVFSEPVQQQQPVSQPTPSPANPFSQRPPTPEETTVQTYVDKQMREAAPRIHEAIVNMVTTEESSVKFFALPALPGTPNSPFRRCPCIGVLPGRACPRCNSSHWVKLCGKCGGEGKIRLNVRKGAVDRVDRCGFCMGVGSVGAHLSDVRAAEEEAKLAMAQQQQSAIVDDSPSTSAPAPVRRHPILPNPYNSAKRSSKSKSPKSKPAAHAKTR